MQKLLLHFIYTIYIYIYGNDAVQRRNISTVSGLHIIQCVGKLRIHVPCFINTHTCANIYVSLPYKLCFNINKSIYIPYKMPTQTNTPKHSINDATTRIKAQRGSFLSFMFPMLPSFLYEIPCYSHIYKR